jgi:hypothetical protein
MRKIFARWKTAGRLAALAVAVGATFVALPISGASAGTNGQQVIYCTPSDAILVMIEGRNQNGDPSTLIKPVDYPGVCNPWGRDRNVSWNWWWKGIIHISYLRGGNWSFGQDCDVPKFQGGDVWNCSSVGNAAPF